MMSLTNASSSQSSGLKWFSRLIYLLTVINAVFSSIYFYELSKLSEAALRAHPHGSRNSFGLWGDYFVLLILLVLLPIYIHRNRHEFKYEMAEHFQLEKELHIKICGLLLCDALPLAISVVVLLRIYGNYSLI